MGIQVSCFAHVVYTCMPTAQWCSCSGRHGASCDGSRFPLSLLSNIKYGFREPIRYYPGYGITVACTYNSVTGLLLAARRTSAAATSWELQVARPAHAPAVTPHRRLRGWSSLKHRAAAASPVSIAPWRHGLTPVWHASPARKMEPWMAAPSFGRCPLAPLAGCVYAP